MPEAPIILYFEPIGTRVYLSRWQISAVISQLYHWREARLSKWKLVWYNKLKVCLKWYMYPAIISRYRRCTLISRLETNDNCGNYEPVQCWFVHIPDDFDFSSSAEVRLTVARQYILQLGSSMICLYTRHSSYKAIIWVHVVGAQSFCWIDSRVAITHQE